MDISNLWADAKQPEEHGSSVAFAKITYKGTQKGASIIACSTTTFAFVLHLTSSSIKRTCSNGLKKT